MASAGRSAKKPETGTAITLLRIPKFGPDWEKPVVEGVGKDELSRGIGHYPQTALPGEPGNFAIAGHRVTHGSPFRKLLELTKGDQVIVETADAVYTYELDGSPKDLTVKPADTWVLDPVPGKPGRPPPSRCSRSPPARTCSTPRTDPSPSPTWSNGSPDLSCRLMSSDRDALLDQVKTKAVVHGKVTLASGKEADYYVDLRRVTLDAEAAPLIGPQLLELTADLEYDAVGGLTLGADPVALAMLHAAAAKGRKLDAFVVRKAEKAHGLQRRVEGPEVKGRRVLAVEDTSTTGGSVLTAVEALREAGAEVVAVVVIVDRATGARRRSRPRAWSTAGCSVWTTSG